MAQRISRREFGARAAATAVGSALLSSTAMAQESKKGEEPHPDIAQLNSQLAKPIPEDLIKGVSDGLKHNEELNKARTKHKLQEGSEPGTVYVPKGVKR